MWPSASTLPLEEIDWNQKVEIQMDKHVGDIKWVEWLKKKKREKNCEFDLS